MDITPLIAADRQVVQSYGQGRFRISGVVFAEPVFVTPSQSLSWNFTGDFSALSPDSFPSLSPGILLLGCGARAAFLPDLRESLRPLRVTLDVMDTGAACRTYNVLMAEGRDVMAALVPV